MLALGPSEARVNEPSLELLPRTISGGTSTPTTLNRSLSLLAGIQPDLLRANAPLAIAFTPLDGDAVGCRPAPPDAGVGRPTSTSFGRLRLDLEPRDWPTSTRHSQLCQWQQQQWEWRRFLQQPADPTAALATIDRKPVPGRPRPAVP